MSNACSFLLLILLLTPVLYLLHQRLTGRSECSSWDWGLACLRGGQRDAGHKDGAYDSHGCGVVFLFRPPKVSAMVTATATRRSSSSYSSTEYGYMLLYEALKYPGLELVLGLELDQKVTFFFNYLSVYLLSCSSHIDLLFVLPLHLP